MLEFEWGGACWTARADRSLVWHDRQTLILADPHFGKAGFFRSAGVPVPHGTTRHNLERIDVALRASGAERLIVLGDFFHSRDGVTDELLQQLADWRRRWDGLSVVNVRGNHDRQAGDPPAALDIACVAGPWRDETFAGLAFTHEPCESVEGVTLCGHLHPAVMLEGLANTRMRAACFHLTPTCGTLPAFGAFTGMKVIRPRRGDRVLAVGPDQVVEVRGESGEGPTPRRGRRRSRRPARKSAGS
jgi:DNA ligase-associated metallophosphoesterase